MQFSALSISTSTARGARVARRFQHANLLLDAAVKPSVILPAPAGGQQHAVGMARQELANGRHAALRKRQIVQAEFEEALAGLVFQAGVAQQRFHVFEAKGDADLWKNRARRHSRAKTLYHCWHPLSSDGPGKWRWAWSLDRERLGYFLPAPPSLST